MLTLLRRITSWFNYQLVSLESLEKQPYNSDDLVAVSRERLQHLEKIEREFENHGYTGIEEYLKYIEDGKCKYALLATDGKKGGIWWPINDPGDLLERGARLASIPDDWRPYFEEAAHARSMIVPRFLIRHARDPGYDIQVVGIGTPSTMDPEPKSLVTIRPD